MIPSSEKIERIFEKYFQKNITLCVNDIVIKNGKFLLIKDNIIGNNYFFELIVEKAKKIDNIRVPFPFHLEEHEDDQLLYFDYRINTLARNNKIMCEKITQWVNSLTLINKNKYLDNVLEIQFS